MTAVAKPMTVMRGFVYLSPILLLKTLPISPPTIIVMQFTIVPSMCRFLSSPFDDAMKRLYS